MKPTSRRLSSVIPITVILLVGLAIGVPGAFLISAAPAAQIVPDFGPVKDINPAGSSNPQNLTAFCCNRPVLFAADDGTNGVELWVTDGTEAGTFMAGDINPTGDSSPAGMMDNSATKFFSANGGATTGVELWRVSGPFSGWTAANTSVSLEKDLNPGAGSSFPMDMIGSASALYLTADDGTAGRELWKKTFSTYRKAEGWPRAKR